MLHVIIQVPDPEQVQALVEFCDATGDDMNKVKCIGALECLAQNYEAIEVNKVQILGVEQYRSC